LTRDTSADQDIQKLRELSMGSGGGARGERLDREGLHERP
jgi:hypothetical protein